MQADFIQEILYKLDNLPYKCILIDGGWGIGKSYAIDEALEEQSNVCQISLFGMKNSQQIYHEVFFQFSLKNSKGGKIGEIVSNIIKGLSSISGSVAQANKLLNNIVKERDLFFLLSKKYNAPHTIVIDDLERISENINLQEVLGIVEELKKCNYIKVILVSNKEELSDENKELLNKYQEKVIDRVYHITERPKNINWGHLGISAVFMEVFLNQHKVKNLRTLQKAQNFYNDVKLYCADMENEVFLNEIRIICFAIVVEDTDNLYYKEIDENEKDSTKRLIQRLNSELEHRMQNYLYGIQSGKGLVTLILEYYYNKTNLDADTLNAEYNLFLRTGDKPNFYKTEEEIKKLLLGWDEKIRDTKNLFELNRFVDEYTKLSDIVEVDSTPLLEQYEKKLHSILWNEVFDGHESILSYSFDVYHLSSEKVRKTYENKINEMRSLLIKLYVDYLTNTTNDKKAYEYSYKLKESFNNFFYRDIIKEAVGNLYSRKSFPIDDMNEDKYHTCFNIMYVLYHCDNESFLNYRNELVNECDKMAVHRIDCIINEIMKG